MGFGGGGIRADKSGRLDGALDADGDGLVSQEEWEAEWAQRGDIASAVTRTTTKYQLAVDFPGATIKNQIGPRSPSVLNTPFTAVKLPPNPPPNPDSPWGKPPVVEKSAAMLFEEELAIKRKIAAQAQYAQEVNGVKVGK